MTPDLPSASGPSLGWVRGQLHAQRVFYGDGDGKAPAIRRPITGSLKVSRFLVGLARRVLDADGALLGVIGLDIADGHVVALRNQTNPDKLAHLAPVGDLAAMMTEGMVTRPGDT